MRIPTTGLLLLVALSSACATAGQPTKGGVDQSNAHDSHITAAFTSGQRDAAHVYFVEQHGKGKCPPGLAKKGNGCLPPGQAKKRYTVGQSLPPGTTVHVVPADLSRRLGPPPSGYIYAQVDGDLLKLVAGTMLVVDAIEALSN
jgi:hypothetical protein